MTITWYTGELPISEIKKLIKMLTRIPAPTAHVPYCVERFYAHEEFKLEIAIAPVASEDASRSGSSEPQMLVKHDGSEQYCLPVFKDSGGRPFIRIYSNDSSIDVLLVDLFTYRILLNESLEPVFAA